VVAAADTATTVAEATEAGTDMAYTKDKDRQSRGVGAIASLDHALPNRQALRRRMVEDTKRRDRAMAAVTKGALGGAFTIPLAPARGVFTRPGQGGPGQPVPAAPSPPMTGVHVFDHRKNAAPPPDAPAPAPAPAPPPTPAPAPAPAPPPTPSPAPASSGGGGAGGGGSSGRGPATSGPATSGPAVDPLPPIPDVQDAAPAADNTTRNLLIAGGAVVAAYLLFFRGRQ
jgi:hypothetical protein